jgi:hypothetical protein
MTRASYSTGLQTEWCRSKVTATVRNTLWARPDTPSYFLFNAILYYFLDTHCSSIIHLYLLKWYRVKIFIGGTIYYFYFFIINADRLLLSLNKRFAMNFALFHSTIAVITI